MSSTHFRSVPTATATGTTAIPLTPSGCFYLGASSIADFAALLDLLPQPARQAFGRLDPDPDGSRYQPLRVAGRTEAQILADIAAIKDGSRPTRVITLALADGSYLFAGIVK